mgnify:CR=1 FL=1
MPSIIQQKAKRAAEDKFEKYVNGETSGFNVLVGAAWADAKTAFENHEDSTGHGVFDFHVPAKDHPEITRTHVMDVLLTMDDFKDDINRVQVMKQGEDDEAKFEISIVYGHLRDKRFDTLVNEHRAKKRRTDVPVKKEPVKKEEEDEAERELAIEREMMEEAAEAEAKALEQEHPLTDAEEEENESSQAGGTLSGYPDDGTTPENAAFEALLKAGTLRLKLVERPGHAPDQAVEPGPKGRKSDVFEHKDLFKQCAPRFFFNGEAKEWRRTAPEGWTGQQPAAA